MVTRLTGTGGKRNQLIGGYGSSDIRADPHKTEVSTNEMQGESSMEGGGFTFFQIHILLGDILLHLL